MGDPVVPMMGMPARVAIDVVPHVQEFFGDDDLERVRARNIDPVEIDKHYMTLGGTNVAVRPANRSPDRPAADPPRKGRSVSGNVQVVDRKRQENDVLEHQVTNTIITRLQDHGGRSAPGGPLDGSAVQRTATLVALAAHHMTRPRIEAQRHQERPHVLIVSDDPSLVAFLSEGLPLGGFWTSVIASGLQALEVFRLRQFDLVVIDATLQSFDAFELMRRLRGSSQRAKASAARTAAPFVVFGPLPEDHQPSTEAQLGIATWIEPPAELEEVVPALHRAFAQWRTDHPDTPLADAAALRDF